jgi:hypothetical protein
MLLRASAGWFRPGLQAPTLFIILCPPEPKATLPYYSWFDAPLSHPPRPRISADILTEEERRASEAVKTMQGPFAALRIEMAKPPQCSIGTPGRLFFSEPYYGTYVLSQGYSVSARSHLAQVAVATTADA